jgi:hypothetical protein
LYLRITVLAAQPQRTPRLQAVFGRSFEVGVAPVLIGFFFLGSLMLPFMGVIGEYVGAIHTMVQKHPFAIEQERIDFEFGPGEQLKIESRQEIKA